MYRKANLKKFAADLKLDIAKFNECLDSDVHAATVRADIEDGLKLDVPGTPTFFINDEAVEVRSLDFEEFQRVIDPYLR